MPTRIQNLGRFSLRRASDSARWGLRASILLVSGCVLFACSDPAPTPAAVGLANPASVNCDKVGGELQIEKNAAGAEYGVCVFEDNRQCEEWALFRGQCPKGGLEVTDYRTPGARYCVIRGGTYTVTVPASEAKTEQGRCELPGGDFCSAHSLFDGTCS